MDTSTDDLVSALSQDTIGSRAWSVISEALEILQGNDPVERQEVKLENNEILFMRKNPPTIWEDKGDSKVENSLRRLDTLDNESTSSRIDFLKDPVNEMTIGRRKALKLMNNKYYNPHGKGVSDEEYCKEGPSLEKAWAYFEHNVLARYIVKSGDGKKEKELERAEPGEDRFPTKLYSCIFTPLNQMGDFGIGVGLYFFTLRFLFLLTFFAGIISIPNILYYNSSKYGTDEYSSSDFQALLLRGTAICSDVSWVPCPMCRSTFSSSSETRLLSNSQQSRFATSSKGLSFALKNNCESPPLTQGMLNYATIIFMFFGFYLMNNRRDRMSVAFDEDEQTAQDYSLIVNNPPTDAYDPEEWKRFFSQFDNAHVTSCTICVDNDTLIKCLAERRDRYKEIQMLVPPDTILDDTNLSLLVEEHKSKRNVISKFVAFFLHPLGLCLDLPALYAKVVILNATILGQLQITFPVTNVFVIFETEEAKRDVINKLSIGILDKLRKNVTALGNKNYLFRSKYILDVFEPEEPSAIRWENLDTKFKHRFFWVSINLFVLACMLGLICFIIRSVNEKDVILGSFVIALFNTAFPMFSKIMTNMEAHSSEGDFQTSLYVKIAFFRFVNYVIVIDLITGFTLYLVDTDDGLLIRVYANFFALLVTSNAIQFIDIFGFLNRHILGPRAPDQDSMNLLFQGAKWDLSERYTNMSNNIFLCFFYCTLYPACFFMSSIALLVTYFVDKYSITRIWARAPHCGTSISKINKVIFSPAALIVMSVMCSYFWSGFPYDNLCEDGTIIETYIGVHFINETSFTESEYLTIHQNQTSYKFCNQNLFKTASFPALSRFQGDSKWMTKDQELITDIFGYTSILVIGLVLLQLSVYAFKSFFDAFKGITRFHGQHFDIKFSEVRSRCAYIPQVTSTRFPHPLLATDIHDIDDELFEWSDPDKPHEFYSLHKDAIEILYGNNQDGQQLPDTCLSKVYHWPPPTVF